MPGEGHQDRGDEIVKLGDLSALRAIADPLRVRILDLLGQRPMSVKALAAELELPRNKLHYHVNVLERHGLIAVAEVRLVGSSPERRYVPTGRTFEARHVPMPPGVASGLASRLETAAREVEARLRANAHGRTSIGQSQMRISEAQHEELISRLRALIDEYADLQHGRDDDAASP